MPVRACHQPPTLNVVARKSHRCKSDDGRRVGDPKPPAALVIDHEHDQNSVNQPVSCVHVRAERVHGRDDEQSPGQRWRQKQQNCTNDIAGVQLQIASVNCAEGYEDNKDRFRKS